MSENKVRGLVAIICISLTVFYVVTVKKIGEVHEKQQELSQRMLAIECIFVPMPEGCKDE